MSEYAEQGQTRDATERAWRERGWPVELLAEARAARVPESLMARLPPWATRERIEDEVRWARILAEGRIHFRQLTPADGDAFAELWANSPEEIGAWDVTVERGPNAFAQFELQERPVLHGLFDGHVMVACVSFSLRPTLVGGQRLWVRYGQAMRVHRGHRRHGYAHWVRSLPWAIGLGRPTRVQYDFIRARNMAMEAWNRKRMPEVASVPKREDEVPGIAVTVTQYVAAPATSPGARLARADDIEACAALINRTHAGRDLFRPYTPESLNDRLDPDTSTDWGEADPLPYTLRDFYVLERNGEIVACAGLWDRGRDVRERWRHRETGAERVTSVTALLDSGYAEGYEDALAELTEHLLGVTHALGRDYLVAPMESLDGVAALLAGREQVPETRYLQWRTDKVELQAPPYLDLVYW